MKKKEILKFLTDTPSTSLSELYDHFSLETKGSQKRLRRVLEEMSGAGEIHYDTGGQKVRLLSDASNTSEIARKKGPRKPKPAVPEKKGLRAGRKPGNPDADGNERAKAPKSGRTAAQDLDVIIEKFAIRRDYPEGALREAEEVPAVIPREEISRRLDLRKDFIVTIDGVDAKDLDDAVSVQKTLMGWKVAVHIADVSYYVPAGSKLDREAMKRGNSFYFINRVVPMFPEVLSNGICSLNPREDRLTLSAIMELDSKGNVKNYEMRETVIHTAHRLNYDWVQAFLDGREKTDDRRLEKALKDMHALFQVLYKKRMSAGGIDFNFREQKCALDESGEVVKIWKKDRQDSERIIEELMLLANQVTARHLSKHGYTLYRIHGEPGEEKFQNFLRLAMNLGYQVRGLPMPDSLELQRILKEASEKPHRELINQILLRTMQQARYDIENIGHYGLGFEFYTHFTSPIRRFADLVVHRLVKESLGPRRQKPLYTRVELEEIAAHISTTERVAMESERDFFKIKAIRFMKHKVGERFAGSVTGVTNFGVFIEIPLFGVEGLVRYQDFNDDYYEFDELNFRAVGRRRKKTITMGDPLRVRVKRADVEKGWLDLAPDDESSPVEGRGRPGRVAGPSARGRKKRGG